MVQSIPASHYVSVVPSVIGAGGTQTSTNGLILTQSTRVPSGSVVSLPNLAAVLAYFGTGSEYNMAQVYFAGPVNATKLPSALLFGQFNTSAIGAFARGNLTVTPSFPYPSSGYSGTFNVVIDGGTFTTSPNLNSSASGAAAAATLQTALVAAIPTMAVVTGSISGTTMTVSAVTSGTLAVGQAISGTGVSASTVITALGTGTGGTGTYTVNNSQTVASTTITATVQSPTVTYDTVTNNYVVTSGSTGANSTITAPTGALATALGMTTATGVIVGQGAAAATATTAGAIMTALWAGNANWAAFTTTFEPSAGTAGIKYALAAWSSTYPVAYAMWSTEAAAAVTPDTTSTLYSIIQANYSGTIGVYTPTNGNISGAAVLSWAASIDFGRTNGRSTLAYKSFVGLTPDVTSLTIAGALETNGYSYYGGVATQAQTFQFSYPGAITGKFKWADSYINQIWMNNGLQLSLMTLLTTMGSVPYNPAGYSQIKSACSPQINAGINFGAIRQGVPLSPLQIAEVTAAAGIDISGPLSSNGFYLQVLDPGATVRAARGSPICTLWYMDGGSIQSINFSSVDVM